MPMMYLVFKGTAPEEMSRIHDFFFLHEMGSTILPYSVLEG